MNTGIFLRKYELIRKQHTRRFFPDFNLCQKNYFYNLFFMKSIAFTGDGSILCKTA